MFNKNQSKFEKTRKKIIERLSKETIHARKGKRIPVNGQYSGIIGREEKLLKLNVPDTKSKW